jgi:hypothetical protein
MHYLNKKEYQISNEILNIINRFKIFLEKFRSIENNYIYVNKILNIQLDSNLCTFNIDILHLAEFDSFLYFKLIQNPGRIISLFDFTINKITKNRKSNNQKLLNRNIKVFFFCSNNRLIQEFDPNDLMGIGSLVKIRGFIIDYSKIVPEMTVAFFKCQNCHFELYSFLEYGHIMEPLYCHYCKKFETFRLMPHRCNFAQKRYIKIQPIYNKNINSNYNKLIICNRDRNQLKIGDYIEIIGISRNIPSFFRNKIIENIFFNSYFDGLFIIKLNSEVKSKFSNYNTSSNKVISECLFIKNKKIIISSIIQNFYLYDFFLESLAPQHCGLDTLKRIILLQSVNSVCVNFKKNKKKLNILLLNCLDVNLKPFLKAVQILFDKKNIFDSDINIKKKYIPAYNIDFFSFFNSKEIGNVAYYHNMLSFRKNIYNLLRKNFSKINEIITIESNFINKKKNKYFMKNEMSLLVNINIEKKKLFENSKKKNHLIHSKDFELFYLLKSINTLHIDRKKFVSKLNYFLINTKKSSINRNNKYLKLGFNTTALLNFLCDLSKFESPVFTKISTIECLKWKNLIDMSIDFHEIIKLVYFENSYNVVFWLSEAIARLRLSNTIGPMDIRCSVLLLLEAIKSFKITKKNLYNKH